MRTAQILADLQSKIDTIKCVLKYMKRKEKLEIDMDIIKKTIDEIDHKLLMLREK